MKTVTLLAALAAALTVAGHVEWPAGAFRTLRAEVISNAPQI